jgi:hypothetical protein
VRFADGDFTLLYALRGQMRQALGATADAENDFRIAGRTILARRCFWSGGAGRRVDLREFL